jgi:hypothetical protein
MPVGLAIFQVSDGFERYAFQPRGSQMIRSVVSDDPRYGLVIPA